MDLTLETLEDRVLLSGSPVLVAEVGGAEIVENRDATLAAHRQCPGFADIKFDVDTV